MLRYVKDRTDEMKEDSKGNLADNSLEEDDDYFPVDIRRLVICTFAIWQIMAAIMWLMPPSALQSSFVIPLRHYMWLTGGDQNWSMFAPNPARADIYLSAQITYQDGSQRSWNFPRMHDLGYIRRYQEERFRKMIEFGHMQQYSQMWPQFARFAAESNNDHPVSNPVVHVDLILNTMYIPDPGTPLPPYTAQTFYQGDFLPGSLPK